MRSKLFVPGSRPELFAKALASDADAVSIDLEDAVATSRKDAAREHVVEFLCSPEVLSSSKIIIVRCNALGTEQFDSDIQAITRPGLGLINLPKVESADDIGLLAEALQRAETSNNVVAPVGILATIESAAGMRRAAKIGATNERVVGLQLGLNDLFESLHIDREDTANVHAAMYALRMAAGEARVFAVDGAFNDIQNEQGFRNEAQMAHRLGFTGKSCIHPLQVVCANEVFMPGAAEVAAATRVLEASRQAKSEGLGAFIVDGKMIDRPLIRRAEEIVAIHQRLQAKQ